MSILQGTDKSPQIGKEQKTLPPNGLDLENLEAPLKPVDHEKDAAEQEKFSGEFFYGSTRGIEKMQKADEQTRKFDALTKKDRLNPSVNHDRTPETPDQEGKDHE